MIISRWLNYVIMGGVTLHSLSVPLHICTGTSSTLIFISLHLQDSICAWLALNEGDLCKYLLSKDPNLTFLSASTFSQWNRSLPQRKVRGIRVYTTNQRKSLCTSQSCRLSLRWYRACRGVIFPFTYVFVDLIAEFNNIEWSTSQSSKLNCYQNYLPLQFQETFGEKWRWRIRDSFGVGLLRWEEMWAAMLWDRRRVAERPGTVRSWANWQAHHAAQPQTRSCRSQRDAAADALPAPKHQQPHSPRLYRRKKTEVACFVFWLNTQSQKLKVREQEFSRTNWRNKSQSRTQCIPWHEEARPIWRYVQHKRSHGFKLRRLCHLKWRNHEKIWLTEFARMIKRTVKSLVDLELDKDVPRILSFACHHCNCNECVMPPRDQWLGMCHQTKTCFSSTVLPHLSLSHQEFKQSTFASKKQTLQG